jgi:hypothetical protein
MNDTEVLQKLIKIYFLRRKPFNNFHGLNIYTDFVDGKLNFFVSNEKDLSVTKATVEAHIDELISNFLTRFDLTISLTDFTKNFTHLYFELPVKQKYYNVYINQSDYKKFQRLVSNVKELKVGDYLLNGKSVLENIDSDGEGVDLTIVFTIYEFYGLNRVRITDTNEVKKIIDSFEFNELFYESQFDYYTNIISEFWDNPLLIDQNYMFVTPHVSFHLYGKK